ncbi:DUF6527 family protein [Cellulophaga tyrosinoxydans]|uniref:Uncharacterized protein n=1 Tax=Cellulophaga tyrosinoxydans TaxID=504486 RepID=A0A1W1YUK4_9FLAO|nr:DUF6527 family protein [Cellulophaga tyrosinoxydans]SMC39793.1 hypothetical protein SAMN05660703_0909 [Cellulophaga tyrosinoxydans]
MIVRHKFVELMPDIIEDGVLYISLDYGTVIHNCACGCGSEVNTPLSPTGWKMIYNGEVVTLKPSVGNWSYDCKSHYWITDGKIEWAATWNDDKIKKIRIVEEDEREMFYKNKNPILVDIEVNKKENSKEKLTKNKWWLWRVFCGD